MKRHLIFGILFIALSFQLHAQTPFGQNPEVGKKVKVNDIDLYYEMYGQGEPLVILHGNGGYSGSRANIMPALIKKYRVITVDHRCHGQSGCSEELNYRLMASDINALLEYLSVDSAYVYGHSDGGILGLIMGFEYPDKVKKLVVSGANVKHDSTALQPYIVEMMKHYKEVPGPMMQKHLKLMVEHPDIAMAALQKIKAPTLIISGDRDAVKLSHTLEIFKSIPNANLSVWPGSTHFVGEENPVQLLKMITEFFENPFRKPSTVDWAKEVAKQIMPNVKQN
ncbi:MAG: alpha/beta hydrolase [Roseivirga sp.]|nr:alpha/beta hydrolase [Roseivirga sp.]